MRMRVREEYGGYVKRMGGGYMMRMRVCEEDGGGVGT